jgi:hypothetical protein
LEEEAEKSTSMIELDVKKPLVASILQKCENLEIDNLA